MTWRGRLVIRALVLGGVVAAFLACAPTPPPYVCVPAQTDTGQQVILCRPWGPAT